MQIKKKQPLNGIRAPNKWQETLEHELKSLQRQELSQEMREEGEKRQIEKRGKQSG